MRLADAHMHAVNQLQQAKHHEHKGGSVPSGDKHSLEDLEHIAVQTRRMLGETLCISEHLLPHHPAVTVATKSLSQMCQWQSHTAQYHHSLLVQYCAPWHLVHLMQLPLSFLCELTEHVAVGMFSYISFPKGHLCTGTAGIYTIKRLQSFMHNLVLHRYRHLPAAVCVSCMQHRRHCMQALNRKNASCSLQRLH